MTERRYSDDEVRAIITRAQPPAGLTLEEIQSIAAEVGLDAEQVARAAASLEHAAPQEAKPRFSFGMPTRVSHSAPLPRALSDEEWARLVGTIRATFDANGKFTSSGYTREWRNGNLRIYIEPGAEGYQLRASTRKGNAPIFNGIGALGLIGSLISGVGVIATGGHAADPMVTLLMSIGFTVAGFGTNLLRLRPWAERRREQMEKVGTEAQLIASEKPRDDINQ